MKYNGSKFRIQPPSLPCLELPASNENIHFALEKVKDTVNILDKKKDVCVSGIREENRDT